MKKSNGKKLLSKFFSIALALNLALVPGTAFAEELDKTNALPPNHIYETMSETQTEEMDISLFDETEEETETEGAIETEEKTDIETEAETQAETTAETEVETITETESETEVETDPIVYTTTISLKAKSATYTGNVIKISSAIIEGSSGTVKYVYYTNSECTAKTSSLNSGASSTGGAPVYAGTYYVKASVAASDPYPAATSTPVKLVIKKAPSAVTLKAKTATYTGKTINIGTAVVKGSSGKVTYSYYKDSGCKTKVTAHKNAGTYYVKASVASDENHTSAKSNVVKLVIKKAPSTVSLKSKTAYYTGNTINIGTAIVKGSSGKVTYSYYKDSGCKTKVTSHKAIGTYYVRATVAADNNYASAKSNIVKLVIKKQKVAQTISGGTYSKAYQASTLRSSGQSFPIGATAHGTLTYEKLSGSSKLNVTTNGTVKVTQGTPAGTYTMSVGITAASTSSYLEAYKNVTITVTVIASQPIITPTPPSSGIVYWTPGGECYHSTRNCSTLSRSRVVYSGTIAQSGKARPCSRCY